MRRKKACTEDTKGHTGFQTMTTHPQNLNLQFKPFGFKFDGYTEVAELQTKTKQIWEASCEVSKDTDQYKRSWKQENITTILNKIKLKDTELKVQFEKYQHQGSQAETTFSQQCLQFTIVKKEIK